MLIDYKNSRLNMYSGSYGSSDELISLAISDMYYVSQNRNKKGNSTIERDSSINYNN